MGTGLLLARRKGAMGWESCSSFAVLPEEILVSVLKHLPFEECSVASLISTAWRCAFLRKQVLSKTVLRVNNRYKDGAQFSSLFLSQTVNVSFCNAVDNATGFQSRWSISELLDLVIRVLETSGRIATLDFSKVDLRFDNTFNAESEQLESTIGRVTAHLANVKALRFGRDMLNARRVFEVLCGACENLESVAFDAYHNHSLIFFGGRHQKLVALPFVTVDHKDAATLAAISSVMPRLRMLKLRVSLAEGALLDALSHVVAISAVRVHLQLTVGTVQHVQLAEQTLATLGQRLCALDLAVTCRIDRNVLDYVTPCSLTSLSVSGVPLLMLAEYLVREDVAQLQKLSIAESSAGRDSWWKLLRSVPQLRVLELCNNNLSNQDVEQIALCCPLLRKLQLSDENAMSLFLSDASGPDACFTLRHLRTFRLRNCCNLLFAAFRQFCAPRLRQLSLLNTTCDFSHAQPFDYSAVWPSVLSACPLLTSVQAQLDLDPDRVRKSLSSLASLTQLQSLELLKHPDADYLAELFLPLASCKSLRLLRLLFRHEDRCKFVPLDLTNCGLRVEAAEIDQSF